MTWHFDIEFLGSVETSTRTNSIVLETISRGLQGPPGIDGGSTAQGVASVSGLLAHHVIVADATGLVHADAFGSNTQQCVGITTQSAGPSATVNFQCSGEIEEGSWAWTVGAPIFCGPLGVLTQTFDPAWTFTQHVAIALTPTKILVSLKPSIVLE